MSHFQPVDPQVSFPGVERRWLERWEQDDIFEKSVAQNADGPTWTFFEGPPTANGMPHPGHTLTRAMKDVFLRYRTMQGFHAPRRAGWDTHGLPVEVEVEKELGIHGKHEIEEYGVERFTRRCIDSVFRYIDEWRRMSSRLAFWIDFDDAYVTFHQSYVESVWWALQQLHKQGLLYQGYKVVWWWPQGGTALSAGEVGQGYKAVDDPAVVVRFRLADDPELAILSWTTTPWTLPSNVGLAVGADFEYAEVREPDGTRSIVASALAAQVMGKREYEVVRTFQGSELIGRKYLPVFDYAVPEGGKSYEVFEADFVTLDSGTGIVQCAPAFGEDDFRVCRANGFGFLQLVHPDGTFKDEVTDFAGRFCKEADLDIARLLKERGLLFSQATYHHDYPFCWRADQDPLIQYARRSWFVKTTSAVERTTANNAQINWNPEHIRDGRMGDFLRNNVDWALSRERWWGTPLPIWVNDETGALDVVGSAAEILERNPNAFDAFEAARAKEPELSPHLAVHKPWVDDITWTKDGEPGVYRRVPEVIDCWFDSGSMFFAQWGYPHRNKDKFERHATADFITEGIDQTRGWWNSLIQIGTLLFPEREFPHPFRNCLVMGHVTDDKGFKLSKSKKNYTDPLEMIETFGADAVRWSLYTSNVPGQNARFSDNTARAAIREFLLKLWNCYSFMVTYASIDEWDPRAPQPKLADRHLLDRWVLAELNETVKDVTKAMDGYDSNVAARRLHAFVDGLSNWYVRRSRERFWAPGQGEDKRAAFATLFEVLVELAHVLAPFTPFVAEEIYQNLLRSVDPERPESVHLTRFPVPQEHREDSELRESMELVRTAVSLGKQVRETHRLKVRQPLSRAICVLAGESRLTECLDLIRDELNVHDVVPIAEGHEYVTYTVRPNFRALGPRFGRQVGVVQKALSQADGGALFDALQADGVITVEVDGEPVSLSSDEVEVRIEAKEGFEAASERGLVVILDTRVTPELRREGLAREVVNRIQRTRKQRDFAYDDRIEVTYEAGGELAEAIAEWNERIAGETLAVTLALGDVPAEGDDVESTQVDDQPFRFRINVSG